MKRIELLAPARDAEIGIEAFRHGADAVYIGAGRFSARAAAGNAVADIERLAAFGHQYGAKTYVALNTILRDDELTEAERLAWQLYNAGVDALIVQDYGLLGLHLPPLALHASTQMDNRTVERARLMRQLGFTRLVVARELSVDEIRQIHQAVPDIEIECFVHGALCVCISGQCYLSACLTGRSANRGECAQPCRLPMDLLDGDGHVLVRQKHLLSLRDMNRSSYLKQLIEAGVDSLKIEGRLKDMGYVKNVVAYYRRQLDEIFENGDFGQSLSSGEVQFSTNDSFPDKDFSSDGEGFSKKNLSSDKENRQLYAPLSEGRCIYTFEPDVTKSFNRGFTSYMADGKREEVMWNHESPKSQGEYIGRVGNVGPGWFTLAERVSLSNGDGLLVGGCIGFRVNRYDTDTRRIYPLDGAEVCCQLRRGMEVWRNLDYAFSQQLLKKTAERRIDLDMHFFATADRLTLELAVPHSVISSSVASVMVEGAFELAKKDQTDFIVRQLSKLGDTVYTPGHITVDGGGRFVPSVVLNQLRRDGIAALDHKRQEVLARERASYVQPDYVSRAGQIDAKSILPSDYRANVLNDKAREMLCRMGIADVRPAYELHPERGVAVMQTKYCLRQALGLCPKYPIVGQNKGSIDESTRGTSEVQGKNFFEKQSQILFENQGNSLFDNGHTSSHDKSRQKGIKMHICTDKMTLKIGSDKFLIKLGCNNACVSEIICIFAPEK